VKNSNDKPTEKVSTESAMPGTDAGRPEQPNYIMAELPMPTEYHKYDWELYQEGHLPDKDRRWRNEDDLARDMEKIVECFYEFDNKLLRIYREYRDCKIKTGTGADAKLVIEAMQEARISCGVSLSFIYEARRDNEYFSKLININFDYYVKRVKDVERSGQGEVMKPIPPLAGITELIRKGNLAEDGRTVQGGSLDDIAVFLKNKGVTISNTLIEKTFLQANGRPYSKSAITQAVNAANTH